MFKVAFITSEISPFTKVGGLADVSGSLPFVLKEKGIDIFVLSPLYTKFFDFEKFPIKNSISFSVSFKNSLRNSEWKETIHRNIPVYFLKNDDYFSRDYVYASSEGEPADMPERYAFFCFSALEFLRRINFKLSILHIQDWQTCFIPLYLNSVYKEDPFFKETKILLTIHNLSYQGVYSRENIKELGFNDSILDNIEFYNKTNILKGGIIFSDFVNTVSPNYAKEILTPEYGAGLEKVLQEKKQKLTGILNGIDYNVWNPETDREIYFNYSVHNFKQGKKNNKSALQKELCLEQKESSFLLGMVSRLTYQKGFDLIIEVMEQIFKNNVQFVLLGQGEEKYERILKEKSSLYRNFSFVSEFNSILAKKIYAGCDLFIIPSRFEPCGLTQMISMRYGTPALVFETGGLKDTVRDYEEGGWGFVFKNYNAQDFIKTLKRAEKIYRNEREWENLILKCMKMDFSWEKSAEDYIKLYRSL